MKSFDLKGNYLLPGFVEDIATNSPWGAKYDPYAAYLNSVDVQSQRNPPDACVIPKLIAAKHHGLCRNRALRPESVNDSDWKVAA